MDENQRNLGYNVSQADIEMLSIYLLKLRLVPVSVNFDHRVFKSPKATNAVLPFEFCSYLIERVEGIRSVILFGAASRGEARKEIWIG
ncbi:MAG: hypothetical protein HY514_01245 [Candidatus Aenigmarchaeota archaeon]|nr:hypothetical protein [Candidatus Aenigmarchaeota archaeon]